MLDIIGTLLGTVQTHAYTYQYWRKVKCASPSSNPLFWRLGILAWFAFWMDALSETSSSHLKIGWLEDDPFILGLGLTFIFYIQLIHVSKPPKTKSKKKQIHPFFLFMGVFLRGSRSLDFLFPGCYKEAGGPPLHTWWGILRPRQSDAVMKKASTQVSVFPKFEAVPLHRGRWNPHVVGFFLWKFPGSSL